MGIAQPFVLKFAHGRSTAVVCSELFAGAQIWVDLIPPGGLKHCSLNNKIQKFDYIIYSTLPLHHQVKSHTHRSERLWFMHGRLFAICSAACMSGSVNSVCR
jgi:hypothetical protein